jgi:uncharacterized pyridoxamine 5'-phosphate oxidase family protein
MDQEFDKKLKILFDRLGSSTKMVLATSLDDRVSARTMSFLIEKGRFYFQTDKTFRKYDQISRNGNVALCVDNVQVEGICMEIGSPADHADFCQKFEKAFPSSFKSYSKLKNERLFEVIPEFIQRWIYEDGMPNIERFDLQTGTYQKEAYNGE